MKLLSWNVQHGGGGRTAVIIAAIAEHAPDVVVLTEYRTKPGATIRRGLSALGWCYSESTEPPEGVNGVCVLSRLPMRRLSGVTGEHAVRWLDLALPDLGIAFTALHIITASPAPAERLGEAKARFWDALLTAAERRINEPLLLVGDFNTGLPYHDEIGDTFHCSEQFARLSDLGWIDLWRHCHGDAMEYTWFSRGRNGAPGNGFRLDHAFAAPALLPRVRTCRYSHREREAGISDHSMMILEVE